MKRPSRLAIIGSGPSAIYLLWHLLDASRAGGVLPKELDILEKTPLAGFGMPYHPLTTDFINLSNISSQELPELPETLADWLRSLPDQELATMDIGRDDITESEIYPRLVLGRFFHAQYLTLISAIREKGVRIREFTNCGVSDIRDEADSACVIVVTDNGETRDYERVVIATGHSFPEVDEPGRGFYKSPWPIMKILPPEGSYHNFAIGTLGASLSACDVLTSLAIRHGDFIPNPAGGLTYHPHPGTEEFRIVMHALGGQLPQLQFELEMLERQVYRHISHDDLLAMVDEEGFLRLPAYFERVCKPVLIEAFEKDGMADIAKLLRRPDFTLEDFVGKMETLHQYADAFEGMRGELPEAKRNSLNGTPTYWKENLDDLIYTVNFHAELLPAEDHILLQGKVLPFLMNVIAAMPLLSTERMLALHDAGKLSVIDGEVGFPENDADAKSSPGMTIIEVKPESSDEGENGDLEIYRYRMFVDCSGQKPLPPEDYSFPSLVKTGRVRAAAARFVDPQSGADELDEEKKERLVRREGAFLYKIGGIDLAPDYRIIGDDGIPNLRIHDMSFSHSPGIRPYSYGLQACSDTARILVESWNNEGKS